MFQVQNAPLLGKTRNSTYQPRKENFVWQLKFFLFYSLKSTLSGSKKFQTKT